MGRGLESPSRRRRRVVVNIKGKQTSMLVKGIKVHSSNHLLGGMIVECENGEIVEQIDNKLNFHKNLITVVFDCIKCVILSKMIDKGKTRVYNSY